jgi:hyperosmotically inducible protein
MAAAAAAPANSADTGDAAADHQITADVKSAISQDSVTKDSDIAVSTSHGVVALKGSVPDQNIIDHVADAVGKVKDVKSVDTSALVVTSL